MHMHTDCARFSYTFSFVSRNVHIEEETFRETRKITEKERPFIYFHQKIAVTSGPHRRKNSSFYFMSPVSPE